MLTLVVRSKRDADALKNMLKNYRGSWDAEVLTLKGARGERILDELPSMVSSDRIYLVLLGREEKDIVRDLSKKTPPNVIVHMVPKKRLRNARLREMSWELEVAKSQPRLWFSWEGPQAFLKKRYIRGEPASDLFLGWGLWWKTLGIGDPSPKAFLVKKGEGGYHEVYSRGRVAAMFELEDDRGPDTTLLGKVEGFDLKRFAELSKDLVESFVKASASLFEGCERVAVPWSGGKDSTAALLIAKRFCDDVKAIYVDTGVDMGLNIYYVKELAERLDVELHVVKAPVKEEIERRGLPPKEDRWCTGLKIKALENKLKELKVDRVVVGDRDAESVSRSKRWEVREWEGVGKVIAPLKLWSAAMVQSFLISEGVPINPLYPLGFYRLGCYICPFLRKYEKRLLREVRAARMGADLNLLRRFLEGVDFEL
ncbi:phosphoadenosine phosphosulfate reductase [Ignicoccus pacificus DSM 13166]|uniref:Phosphoadenosine phosphosulfate reductase n=1 Tax=Ignicoccus pacificus DSM 13166 TaxID=940294 RepID=A0A977KBL3_9CREN|nr:phosphoadenosine phosphosulfate reductase [Ignicoccus pacificus DSM 13166]